MIRPYLKPLSRFCFAAARVCAVAGLALGLSACAKDMALLQTVQQVATAEVPASVVIPTANAFDILKGTAANYARYCVANNMPQPICSDGKRRAVVKFVRSGTAARDQLEDSIENGTPAAASLYNVLAAAVQGLQGTPAASAQFK